MTGIPTDLLACPRCDRTPLDARDAELHCAACKVDFPAVSGIPWLFAEPEASLAEWRSRLHAALQRQRHELESLDRELAGTELGDAARARVRRYRDLLEQHRSALTTLLAPLGPESLSAAHESYLALRTRLPSDQGLNTYYANVHRDWAWGDEENARSIDELRAVLGDADDAADLGDVLVLGAGAGRLAYDLHRGCDCRTVTALDFNPLLVLVAQRMYAGDKLELVEFPLAPLRAEDDAVVRELAAPAPAADSLSLVLGDALRPPFAAGRFDTVVTPWLIDIVAEDFPTFAARMHRLLVPGGRWLNFGSLAFAAASRAGRYPPGEVLEILEAAGFAPLATRDAIIPYMCSPASRHGRQEQVFTFAARKTRAGAAPRRYRALPDWIVTGEAPVPLVPAFRTQAMAAQIYAFTMSLIDGKRSIRDMAVLFEQQRLMPRDEAIAAIRGFLIKMFEDANRSG